MACSGGVKDAATELGKVDRDCCNVRVGIDDCRRYRISNPVGVVGTRAASQGDRTDRRGLGVNGDIGAIIDPAGGVACVIDQLNTHTGVGDIEISGNQGEGSLPAIG